MLTVCIVLIVNFDLGQPENIIDCKIDGPVMALYKVNGNPPTLVPEDTTFDSSKTTYFVIHGWKESSTSPEYQEIASDLYAETQGNVILVDYDKFAAEFYFPCAWNISTTVGNLLAKFVDSRLEAGDMHPSRVHIIGHSLGGQVAGQAARKIKEITGIKVKRISALDPAGPFFGLSVAPLPKLSLSATDAELVDVTHTSTIAGMISPLGHADFYMNGIAKLTMDSTTCLLQRLDIFCYHGHSKSYFRESIRSCGIKAIENQFFFSPNSITYGFHMPLTAKGVYNFYPNKNAPYGTGAGCP